MIGRACMGCATLAVAAIAFTPVAFATDTTQTATDSVVAPQVSVRSLGGERIFARARVALPASPEEVFALIADFDRLNEFVSAIDTSRVMHRDSSAVLVRQVGSTVLLVRKTVRMTLRFRPEPPSRLWFEIVEGDFETYSGSWQVQPDGEGGTRLTYDVTFNAPALVPGPLVRRVVERDLTTMMRELHREVVRLGASVTAPGSAP